MAESQSPRNLIPIELRGLKRSPNCTFYRNGDVFFPGERLCINKKQYPTLDSVKDFLTNRILEKRGKAGHIRGIFTPRNGTRVVNLDQLEDKGQYVAAVNDVYQPLQYNEISSTRPRPIKPKQFDFSNGAIWDREGYAYVQPVVHNDQLRLISGRARKENENKHAIRIRAYANGDDLTSGCTVCIDRKLHDMDMIKDILAMKLNIRAERIFKLDGTEILDSADFEADMRVVCVPRYEEYRGEKFNRFYGEIRPNLTTSPRPTFPAKYSVLPPIRGGGESRSTKNGGGSPEHSVNSTTRNKRGMAPNSNHATKPKQKRTPETGKRIDYDKDEGGVYKAKNPRNETVGAKQVKETHETKTDLPIDQRKAEVVKEEIIPGKVSSAPREKSARIPSGTELNKLPSDEDNPKKSPDEFLNKPKSPGLPPQKTHEEGDAGNTRPGTQDKGKDQISAGDEKPETNDWDDDQINTGNTLTVQPPSDRVDHPVEISEHNNDSGLHNSNTQFAESSSQVTPRETITHKPATPKGAENDPLISKQDERIKGENSKGYNNDKPKKTDPSHNKQASNKFNDDWDDPNAKNSQFRSSTPSPRKEDTSKTKNKGNQKREEEAATKIQAHFKGYKARQEYQVIKTEQKQQQQKQQQPKQQQPKQKQEDDPRKQSQKNKKPSMDENVAATKIQAGFRGYKTRKELNEKKQVRDEKFKKEREETGREENLAATRIQAGYRGYKTRKEIKAQKASVTKTDTKKDGKKKMNEDEAATKIQAGYRGHIVRKNLKISKSSTQAQPNVTKPKKGMNEHEAATRVQAGFHGYKTRKDMKTKKADQEPSPNRQQGKKYGEREEKAAVRIQAGFRGYKARKEYKNTKVIINERNVDQLPDTLRLLVQKEEKNQHANILDGDKQVEIGDTIMEDSLDKEEKNQYPDDGDGDKQVEIGEEIIEDSLDRDEENQNPDLGDGDKQVEIGEEIIEGSLDRNEENQDKNNLNEMLENKPCAKYIVQAAFRGSLTRMHIRELKSKLNREQTKANRKANDKRKEILKLNQSRLLKANKAATTIQANVHGFFTRQKQKHLAERSKLQTLTPNSKDFDQSRQAVQGHRTQPSSPIIDGTFSDSPKNFLSYQGPTEPDNKRQRKGVSTMEETSESKLRAGTMVQAAFHAYLARGEMRLSRETKGTDSGIDSDNSIVEDNTSPETKIQAAFHAFQSRCEANKFTRKSIVEKKTISLSDKMKQVAIAVVQAALKAFVVREETAQIETKPSKLELYSSKDITSEKVKAATIIQAASRGALARKNWEPMVVINFGKPQSGSQILDWNKAASIIQAYFRAFKERRLKDAKHRASIVRSAATKIQAAMWANKARQEMSTYPQDLTVILYGGRKEADVSHAVRERTELSRIEEEESVIEERAKDDKKDSELKRDYSNTKGSDDDQRSNSSITRSDTSEIRRHENPQRTDPERSEEGSSPGYIRKDSFGEHSEMAIKIQSAYRRYMARKRVQKLLEERFAEKRQMEAAVKIQSGYRGYRSRKDIKKTKNICAVATIHAVFRGLEARKSAQYIESLKKRNEAAVIIQARYRGYRGKVEAKKRKKERTETQAAVKIQARYRGYKARRDVEVLKSQQLKIKSEQAAVKIQSRFRGYKTRKETASIRTENQKAKAASIIQAVFHAHHVRRESNQISKQAQAKEDAALLIQCVFRGYLCRRELKYKQQERFDIEYEEWKIKRENASKIIQAAWRGYKVRKEIQEREDMLPDEFVKTNKDLEEDSLDSDIGGKSDTVQKQESFTEEDESNTETIPEVELNFMSEEIKSLREESQSEKENSQNQEEALKADNKDLYEEKTLDSEQKDLDQEKALDSEQKDLDQEKALDSEQKDLDQEDEVNMERKDLHTMNRQPTKKDSMPVRRNPNPFHPKGYLDTDKENVHVKGNPLSFNERQKPVKYIVEPPKKKNEKSNTVMENQKSSPVKDVNEQKQKKPFSLVEVEKSPPRVHNFMISPRDEMVAPVRLEPILEDTEKLENMPRKRKLEKTRRKRKLPPHQRNIEADTELLVLNFERKKTAEEIEEEQRILKQTASSIIQAGYHGLKARQGHRERVLQLTNRSASVIQAAFKFLKSKRALNYSRDSRCATKLQAACWGLIARKNTRFRTWSKASVIIQAGVKGLKVRRFRVNKRMTETQTKTRAASAIQAGVKATKQRREMRAVRSAKQRVEETHQCAILIQSCFRGYHVRRYLKERQEQIERERQRQLAANTLQSCCRGFFVRKDLKERAHQIKIHTAVNKIQSGYLSYRHFTECQRKRAEERERQRRNKAATKVQSVYKGYRKRAEYIAKRASVIKLQAYYRGHLARKEASRRREERRRNGAALVIQSHYRGFVARKEARQRKKEKKQKEAATKIQSHYRGHKARVFVKNKKQELKDFGLWAHNFLTNYMMDYLKMYELRKAASTVVQAHVRGHSTRIWLEEDDDYQWRLSHRRQNRHDAACKIQAHFRGHVTRREIKTEKEFLASLQPPDFSKETLEDYLKKPRRSAARVQAAVRGYLVREEIETRLHRKAYIKQITPRHRPTSVPELTIGDAAALKIQSFFRGYVDRSLVRKIRKEKWQRAATVIQAVFKAYHTRNLQRGTLVPVIKQGKIVYHKKAVATKIAEKAASRIQAGFKMYLLRKQINMLRVEM
ncbi:hypothetical protein ACJMK2_000398 [Sinanodonta woodiana]|uniref:Doublecortin domain-containing protein n=1 Tax=Sinanodonta woodiana TaxID=1069815 RepID=A0ABD3XP83_SINWO